MSEVPPGARELNTGRPLNVVALKQYADALPEPKRKRRKRKRSKRS